MSGSVPANRASKRGLRSWVSEHPVVCYVIIAYALSWAYWLPLAVSGATAEQGVGWPSQMPGLTGPAIAALIVTALIDGTAGLGDLWDRLSSWRIGWWWMTVVAILLAGAVGLAVTGGADDREDLTLYNGIGAGLGPIATISLVFVLNGLGEEVGWRGFMAERLLLRHRLTTTALLVALVWAPWHTPLFFFLDSFEGFSVVEVLGWALGLTAGSVVLTWLYRGSRGSILLVAVWHTAFNFTSATPAAEGTAAAITSTVVMVAAVAIVLVDLKGQRGRNQRGQWT